MKRVLFLAACLLTTVATMAIPTHPNLWQQRKTADGHMVSVQKHGDEHGYFWLDRQGNCYTDDGNLLQPISATSRKSMTRQAATRRQQANRHRLPRRIVPGTQHQPYAGKKKGLIILVNFTDVQFEAGHDRQLYDDIANKPGFTSEYGHEGSVHDYFLDQSQGVFDLTFDVVGPIQLTHERSYYGANSMASDGSTLIDPNAAFMISEACRAVDTQVDFANYDWDDDGTVDQVMVIYPGHGENGLGDASTVYPHEYQLSSAYIELELDGKKIDTYACTSELTVYQDPDANGQYATGIDGIGTLCHEFSHCLGLPDMYDTGDGVWYGMGTWDIMDGGAYNGRAFLPASFTAYERMYAGWQQPIVLSSTDVTVADMKSLDEGGNTYIIYNAGWKDEYYLLENRQPVKWDRGLYGRGLLITHVDFKPYMWEYNWVNYSDILSEIEIHPCCSVVAADDSYIGLFDGDVYIGGADIAGDTYPYGERDSLSNTSQPRAFVYNYRENTDGSDRLNHAVTGITQNGDGTMAFYYRAVDTNTEQSDDLFRTGEVFFKETFDQCAGRGGNDGLFAGSTPGVGKGNFLPDEEGWPKSMYGGNQCGSFGDKSGNTVTVYTPDFHMHGKAYLTFKAAPFKGENTQLRVNLDVWQGTASIADTLFTLNDGEWTECRTYIQGQGNMYLSVTFTAQQRMFIDEVLVQAPLPLSPEGIEDMNIDSRHAASSAIFDLQGRRLTAVPSKGIYIKDGRKHVAF